MTRTPSIRVAQPAPSLPPALDAEEGDIDMLGEGRVHYYADRKVKGRPVLLLHSINAAASSYEMRPLFEALRRTRRVFALDLPGFGRSAHDARRYTPELFARALERFIVDVVSPQGEPCDACASSLSCEFLARAAVADRELFHSLTLLSPTGLSKHTPSMVAEALRTRVIAPLLHVGPLARGVFNVLSTRRSIRYFLARSFAGRIDESLADYAYQSAHTPGAERAPMAFVAGELFTQDAATTLYAALRVPTLVLYDQDPYTDFSALDIALARNPNLRAQRLSPSRGMLQFEHTDAVAEAISRELTSSNGS